MLHRNGAADARLPKLVYRSDENFRQVSTFEIFRKFSITSLLSCVRTRDYNPGSVSQSRDSGLASTGSRDGNP
jgi:hypothetical protein